MATPSWVEVPRPSSSIITRERGVASCSAIAASCSSTMNVLEPLKILSLAPILAADMEGGREQDVTLTVRSCSAATESFLFSYAFHAEMLEDHLQLRPPKVSSDCFSLLFRFLLLSLSIFVSSLSLSFSPTHFGTHRV